MKRDMDLVRAILKIISDSQEPFGPRAVDVQGYSEGQIGYHIKIMIQAGLIEAVDTTSDTPAFIHPNLTWTGQDFIETAKNERVWQKMKAELKDRGMSLPFSLIQALLLKIAAEQFGLKNGN